MSAIDPQQQRRRTAAEAASPRQSRWRRWGAKFLNGNGIFTFLRSTVTSQISSWTDMIMAFVFYAWVFAPLGQDPLRSSMSTVIGLVIGGIVNCSINYKFTFTADHCPVKAMALKFLLIWTGNLILNTCGTTGLDLVLQNLEVLRTWGFKPDGIFATARLSVSLVVSLAWNYPLNKNFVYMPTRFDATAIRIVDRMKVWHLLDRHTPAPDKQDKITD